MSIEICAYKTSDGELFESRKDADSHQSDILGELFDDFLPHDDRGNITQVDRFNILVKIMEDENLVKKVTNIYNALTFTGDL